MASLLTPFLDQNRDGSIFELNKDQLTDPDKIKALAAGGAEARRAFEAMMPMKKIDVAAIEKARRG